MRRAVEVYFQMSLSSLGKDDEDEDEEVAKSPKGKKGGATTTAKSKIPEVSISADAQSDVKKALEVSTCLSSDIVTLNRVKRSLEHPPWNIT